MIFLISSAATTYTYQSITADQTVIVEANVTMAELNTLADRTLFVNYGTLRGSDSSTGSAVTFQQNAGGSFINKAGAVVARAHNTDPAVDIRSSSTNVTNEGTILSNGHGIQFVVNANNNIFHNSGDIYAGLNGIWVSGASAQTVSITNTGEIWGDANGIHMENAQGAAPVIVNSGLITGRANSIVASGGDRLDVTNTGTLQGDVVGVSAQLSDSVTNNGMIVGDVKLGSGVDSYRGTGTVTGTVFGEAGVDTLTGGSAVDKLDGGADGDTLYGGIGSDTMIGGTGNDTYYVDSVGDTVNESGAGDTADLVYASISFSLAASAHVIGTIEKLTLLNVAAALSGTGNAAANTITGNSFGNVLNGGVDNLVDALIGGLGNDIYLLGNSTNDVVVEATGNTGGIDTATSSISRSLTTGGLLNVENLALVNVSTAINGIGNNLKNVITGNTFANVLNGGLGNDTLNGSTGNDVFVFNTALNAATNKDTIDFQNVAGNNDSFQLDNAVFAKLGANGALNPQFFKQIGAAPLDGNDYIQYNKAAGALSYDADGNLGGVAVQFATLINKPALAAADFIVI